MTNTWMESVHEAARKHGADPERAWAWELFSDLYLDTEQTEDDLKGIAKQLAETRFTISELVHIYDKDCWFEACTLFEDIKKFRRGEQT